MEIKKNRLIDTPKEEFSLTDSEMSSLLGGNAYNSLAELCEQTYHTIELGRQTKDMDFLDEETISQLLTMKVIVNNDDDEINKVRYINMLRRPNNRRLILTINPTLVCNFNRPYCFETTHPNTYMSDKVEDDIIQYISSNKDIKAIDVTWFGGEPLLAFDRAKSLTPKIKKRTTQTINKRTKRAKELKTSLANNLQEI